MAERRSKEYLEWKKEVIKRDGRKCQWPLCTKKHKLECHHILPYARYEGMRIEPCNGIMLCKKHHAAIRNKEVQYSVMLLNIVKENIKKHNERMLNTPPPKSKRKVGRPKKK